MNSSRSTCDWCDTEGPQWLRWVDNGPAGYMHRKLYGMPGPTAKAYRACDDCLPKMRASFPSEGDQEAIDAMRKDVEALP